MGFKQGFSEGKRRVSELQIGVRTEFQTGGPWNLEGMLAKIFGVCSGDKKKGSFCHWMTVARFIGDEK